MFKSSLSLPNHAPSASYPNPGSGWPHSFITGRKTQQTVKGIKCTVSLRRAWKESISHTSYYCLSHGVKKKTGCQAASCLFKGRKLSRGSSTLSLLLLPFPLDDDKLPVWWGTSALTIRLFLSPLLDAISWFEDVLLPIYSFYLSANWYLFFCLVCCCLISPLIKKLKVRQS